MRKTLLFLVTICAAHAQAQLVYQWAKNIAGSGYDYGYSIAADAQGNVYITGNFSGISDFDPGAGTASLITSGSEDIFIAKYDNNGNYVWAKSIGGTGIDNAYSISLDASGNVYTTGIFENTVDFDPGAGSATLSSAGNTDVFIAKYDNSGNYLWARNMGGTNYDLGQSISVDVLNNVNVTGYFGGVANFDLGAGTATLSAAGTTDIFIARYDMNGNYLWARGIGSTSSFYESGNSIIADASGNVYVTGSFAGTADFDPGVNTANLISAGGTDIFIAKYDNSGNFLWANRVGSSNSFGDSGNALKIDPSGNLYLTGTFNGSADFNPGPGTANLSSAGNSDIFLSKYDNNGNYIWARKMGGANTDNGVSIALDTQNRVYLTGSFDNAADFDPGPNTASLTSVGGTDIFIAYYDSNGNYVWARNLGSTTGDWGQSITTDPQNNMYATGRFQGTADFNPSIYTATLVSGGVTDVYITRYSACAAQTVNNQQSICAGKTYLINNHAYTLSGIYNDTLHTAYGCDSVIVTQLTVNNLPGITIGGSFRICINESTELSASGAGSYSWSTNENQTSINVSPIITTTYTVRGADNNGCLGAASVTVFVDECAGLYREATRIPGFKIYPNPSSEILNVELNTPEIEQKDIQVFDILGIEIKNEKLVNGKAQVDVTVFPKGVYLLKVGKDLRKFIRE